MQLKQTLKSEYLNWIEITLTREILVNFFSENCKNLKNRWNIIFFFGWYCVIWTKREENSSQRNAHILAGNQRSGPVKVSVVGGGQGGSKIWRRERIEMTDPDLDDVAFLSGMLNVLNLSLCNWPEANL